MTTKDYLNRLKKFDQLIRQRATGTPAQLAEKLNISERMVYNYINELRDIGLPITYCNQQQSYIYTKEGSFYAGFIIENQLYE